MDTYVGNLKYQEQEVLYSFDGEILKLYPNRELGEEILYTDLGNGAKALTSERKPLTQETLTGTVLETGEDIIFLINPLNYGYNGIGIQEYVIEIPVYKYIVLKPYFSEDFENIKIYYLSKEFFRFLEMKPKVDFQRKENNISSLFDVDISIINKKSTFTVDNMECELAPTWSINHDNGYNLTLGLSMLLKTNEFDIKKVLKHVDCLCELIRFLFYRNDICPDKLLIYSKNRKGEIYINRFKGYIASTEEYGPFWRDSIPWSLCYNIVGTIYGKIFNDDIYMLHIPEKLDKRLFVSITDISILSSAFENTFRKLYKKEDLIISEKRLKAEEAAKSKIKDLIDSSTSKEKEIYKFLFKRINDKRLEELISFCFEKYEPMLVWVKGKFAPKMDYKEISKKCADNRNDIDHGNKNKFDKEAASPFGMLRVLVLCMQLKLYGMQDDDITKAVRNVFGLRQLGYK